MFHAALPVGVRVDTTNIIAIASQDSHYSVPADVGQAGATEQELAMAWETSRPRLAVTLKAK